MTTSQQSKNWFVNYRVPGQEEVYTATVFEAAGATTEEEATAELLGSSPACGTDEFIIVSVEVADKEAGQLAR